MFADLFRFCCVFARDPREQISNVSSPKLIYFDTIATCDTVYTYVGTTGLEGLPEQR